MWDLKGKKEIESFRMGLSQYQLTKRLSITMNSIPHSGRYLPNTIDTRHYSVKIYRGDCSVNFVCRKYYISRRRWCAGTSDLMEQKTRIKTSLIAQSTQPNAHIKMKLKWINDLHRRNPHVSICEMFGKSHSQKGYSRHLVSIYRIYKALSFYSKALLSKKKCKPQKYYTPDSLGIK